MKIEDVIDDLWRISPARMAAHLASDEFQRFKHIDYLDRILMRALVKGGARLIVSMPPRHGKSWLTSYYTPVWHLALWPKRTVILASYEASFAASWGRRVRNFIDSHSQELGIKLSDDSAAADRFHLTAGGGMVTAGAGGSITGRGAHLVIVDDPIKNQEEAFSQIQRDKLADWFASVVMTRLEPGGSIVVMMTRWHQDDLIGRILREQSGWSEIRLPALAEADDPLGRTVGEALCPERYDTRALDERRLSVGSRVWEALYQQRPSAEQGNIFKREWWRSYRELPQRFDETIMSCDLTFKDSRNSDYVVIQVWGRVGASRYLIDQIRARMDFPATIRAIRAVVAKYPQARAKLVEDKANGPAVIAQLKTEIPGLIPVEPNGTKEARASAISPFVEAGNVFIPDASIAPWAKDFIDECANFPFGAHDDMVDAMTQALLRLRQISYFPPIVGFRDSIANEWRR